MLSRVLLSTVVATAVLASGCSGSKSAAPGTAVTATKSSTTQAQTGESASPTAAETSPAETAAPAGPKLGGDACVQITGGNLDLATATNSQDARKAGDTMEKYDPPADVKAAIEHFVETGGAQFDDPDYDKNNKLIDDWAKQVCPLRG
jgi:hypothetical protein